MSSRDARMQFAQMQMPQMQRALPLRARLPPVR
jgi:hypothetical protein